MNRSTYALNSFLVMIAVFGGCAVLFGIIFGMCIWRGLRSSAHRSLFIPRMVVCSLNITFGFVLLTLGVISGYDWVHPAVTILIGCVLWVGTAMSSIYFMWGQWRSSGLDTRAGVQKGPGVVALLKRVVALSLRHSRLFNVICVIGYLICYSVVFSMYGMCYCSNPFQVTTWSSRRNQAKYCFADQFCHQYVMLGRNYSRVRVVGHVVSYLGTPQSTTATLCPYSVASQVPNCSEVRTLPGRIVPHVDKLGEDPRYVSQVLLTDLAPQTNYHVNVVIVLADGRTTSSNITFHTVAAGAADFTFISGGDMLSTNTGQWVMFLGFAVESDPAFVLFGGDLSYSNNMRTCFLRFDFFCALISSLRNADGLSVPLLILPGNHESGGYLPEKQLSEYNFFTQYFPQYDEDVPASYETTHHAHDVGQVTVLALDSGLMEPVVNQVGYATGVLQDSLRRHQTLVAAYHNPLYPSIRSYDDKNSANMRTHMLPVFLAHNLTLGLEFHDHAYKRTFMVDSTGPQPTNTDGIVFIGDGGLGTQRDASSSGSHWYVARFEPVWNVQVIRCHINGTLAVRSFTDGKTLLETVVLRSRSQT